jgi:hypothetical protein
MLNCKPMKKLLYSFLIILCAKTSVLAQQVNLGQKLNQYVKQFNADDNEAVKNLVPNADAYLWLNENIPLLDFPDKEIEEKYYFRWWSFRKHLKQTPDGYIFTEFIEPVKHAGKHQSISCALGHHIYEGRWLKNQEYMKQYLNFWLYDADKGQSKPRFHQFSSWVDDAVLAQYMVHPDKAYLQKILPALDADYEKWEQERKLKNGMFWQHDVKDGMEESVSGSRRDENMRPTINSYMYGNAKALALLANEVNNPALTQKYASRAAVLKQLVQDSLWDAKEKFFKTKMAKGDTLHGAREAIGFIPWYFNLPADKKEYAKAWSQLLDTAGFKAKWGLTTAERREPTFRTRGSGHGCEWDGAVWPFASSQTLRGLSNLLNNYSKKGKMNASVFYNELHKYAWSQQMYGKPYIGEYQDESNGEWLKGDHPRSKFYNHSTFMDLVIQDLIGLKPQLDNSIIIKPLIPKGKVDWFQLSQVPYKGKILAIIWDKTGERYQKGKGLMLFADGKLIAQSKKLQTLKVNL